MAKVGWVRHSQSWVMSEPAWENDKSDVFLLLRATSAELLLPFLSFFFAERILAIAAKLKVLSLSRWISISVSDKLTLL